MHKLTFYALISMSIACFCVINESIAQNVVISDDPTYSSAANGALLDLHSQNGDMGLLIPSSTDPSTIAPAANGLLVYDSDDFSYYFYSNNTWVRLCGPSGVSVTYGEMYQPLTANPQSIPGTSVWIGLSNLQSGNSSGISFTDDDTNGDYLLIPSGGAGAYKVSVTINASCSKNNNISEASIVINASENPEPNIHTSQELNSGGNALGLTGIVLLNGNDQLRVKLRANNTSYVVSANVNIVKLD